MAQDGFASRLGDIFKAKDSNYEFKISITQLREM